MNKINTDNSDIIDYFNTLFALKEHPDIKDYWRQYHYLRQQDAPTIEVKQFYSAHTALRRLDKKRNNLLGSFISELNPVRREKTLESIQRRSLARTVIRENTDDEIISMVIKQRTEAALEFQRAVENTLNQLSAIASTSEHQQQPIPRRKMMP